MEWNIALLVYVVLQFIAFMLVLVATPLDMFRFKNENRTRECITLWGLKDVCTEVRQNVDIDVLFGGCPGGMKRFFAAEVLAIFSIFIYGTAFFLSLSMLLCSWNFRFSCLVLNIVGALTVWIVWAAMVMAFFKDGGLQCPALRKFTRYGVGFVLFVVAWLLDIINIIFMVLLMMTEASSESNQKNKTSEKSSE